MNTATPGRVHASLIAVASVLVLNACSMNEPQAEPAPGSTVQIQADYAAYSTTDSLAEEATLIVEGTAIAAEPTVLTPRFEGDNPQENPLLGLSDEEKAEAIKETDAIPATAITVRADVVHRGAVKAGQEFVVVQTGGVIDGVTYDVDGEADLAAGEQYLLFATDSFDGKYAVLGGAAGAYEASGTETFTATAPDVAPAAKLTSSEVDSLVD